MNTRASSFFSTSLTLALAGALSLVSLRSASAASVNLNPSKDNTLYEYVGADGDRSNGAGDRFFAGRTDQNYIRRGVIAFNVAANIPATPVHSARSRTVRRIRLTPVA